MTNWWAGVQMSVATTFGTTLGTEAEQLASTEAVIGPVVVTIVGAVVSTTLKETLAVETLPEASVTVTVIVCRPKPREVPAAGFWVMTNWLADVQLSVATTFGTTLGTEAEQLASTEAVIGLGVVTIVGAVVSTTLKETLAIEALPEASVTVTVIVCRPKPREVPAAGFWVMTNWLAGVQLSVATTFGTTLGTEAEQLASTEAVIGLGA